MTELEEYEKLSRDIKIVLGGCVVGIVALLIVAMIFVRW